MAGALAFVGVLGGAPACAAAAWLWWRACATRDLDVRQRLMRRAAGWTALGMALQALSLFATLWAAFLG